MKRALSLILVWVMLLGMVPVNGFAAGTEDVHEHIYEAAVTAPTCTERGYTTYTCECGDSYVSNYADAEEHTYENGLCTICGKAASPYLQQLPENIIGCTNLYEKLAPVKGYYTAVKYDTSNGAVLSVVIPVKPGDRIAASSFGPVSENMGSVNGIRVTYLLGDTIVTSLSAGDVYNGYTSNGYITVPDGVDAVCVPWWKPSDSNWLTLEQISKNFAVHSPKAVPAQAPTCTEKGYTAGEICEVCEASLEGRAEIAPAGHTYSGDTCNACGAVNIEAILGGKYVSILGDSISTFNGYSNDDTVNTTIGGNGPRYDAGAADTKPGSYCLLESVNDTWWMHFAGRSGMNLLVNNSWAGSQVFGGKTSDGRVIPAAYLDRCVNLHDNTLENNPGKEPINPDVIFVYLGINDYNFNRSKVGNGAVDYAGLVDSNGTCVTPATFGEAYGIMLHKMRSAYPDAQIFAMTLLPENLYSIDKTAWEQHNTYIRAAAEYYDIPVVDLAENCAITWENYSRYMIDKIHPTTAGMKLISDCIEKELQAYYKENPPHTHTYKNGTCTGCGEADPNYAQPLPLRYDDHYDITGKTVEILDAGKPTSWQVGYGIAENTVADTAVVTLEDQFLVATGIGTATVRIDGTVYEITVEAAPISLLLLIGQSNMQGSEGDANQSIVCPDGMVYSTYGDRYTMTTSNATNFAPSALTGPGSNVNVNGSTTNLSDWPVYLLNEAGAGKAGPDSGYAYEWVKQTGEKVWVVNAAHGGTSINVWQEGTAQYEECLALFSACQETLRKEIAAGHFTLSHTGYFWCQGCTDETQTAQWYVKKFLSMHASLNQDLTRDLDGDGQADPLEFANITVTLAGHVNKTGYRYEEGLYNAADSKFFTTYEELEMRGQRVAQYWLASNPDYPEINMVCNIGERWVTMPDGTDGVAEYFSDHYEEGIVDYTTQVPQNASWYKPTTVAAVKDSIHYNQIGYNEVGMEAARNTLTLLGEVPDSTEETTVRFVDWTGYREVLTVNASTTGNSGTLVVPIASPCYRAKNVAYQAGKGLNYLYFDLLADSEETTGSLSAIGASGTVAVELAHHWSAWETVCEPSVTGPGMQKRVCSDCGETETKEIKGVWQTLKLSDHMRAVPDEYCCATNLWTAMEHDKYFFNGTSSWNIHASGTVYSVTIPVHAGDQIFATAFGGAGENGGTKNGIRLTFFDKDGVVKTYAPADTYAAFTKNGGFLIAPKGSVAANIPMWNNSDDNEIYILNRDHTYQSTVTAPTCTEQGYTTYTCACGDSYVAEQVKPAGHSYSLPVFHWSEDYSCSVSVSCTVCGESQNLSCNITAETIPATEQAEGRTTYTATVNWNDRIYQDTQVVLIPKKEHTVHTPGKQWYTDNTSHWKECTICEEQTHLSHHIPGPAPTENTSQKCTVCGFVLHPPLGLDWLFDRANAPDSYLWASGTYAKILEQFP